MELWAGKAAHNEGGGRRGRKDAKDKEMARAGIALG